jgi:uncharacterized protein YunC (DUF1805 family)
MRPQQASHVPREFPAVLADSATALGVPARGRVVVSGSHGGLYPARLIAAAGARAAVFNDAGVGMEKAGIRGIDFLDEVGIAAAAVSCTTCRIGDAADALARGIVSHVNDHAFSLGCRPGMPCRAAVSLLRMADRPDERAAGKHPGLPPALSEGNGQVIALDSASFVMPWHSQMILMLGSHGGLPGGQPSRALRADASAAVFNDAGIGIERAGVARLPVLDRRQIPAAAVAADSARIGDGASTFTDGIISTVNQTAENVGARIGMSAREFAETVLETNPSSAAIRPESDVTRRTEHD